MPGPPLTRHPSLALIATCLIVASTGAAKSPLCPTGRYVVSGTGAVLVVGDGRATLGGLDSVRFTRKASRRGTQLRARLGLPGRTSKLVARLVDDCSRVEGTLKTGRAKPQPFSASRSVCGDAVVDSGSGEQCDGNAGCNAGSLCDGECRCLPPGVTTTTATTTASTTGTGPSLTTTTRVAPVPLPGLPPDVTGFEQWLRLNTRPIPAGGMDDPHNGTKDVYVNQTRETVAPGGVQRFPYPAGTIVVKASTRPERDFIGLIAIMRKRPGFDPAHGDWEFVEYTRSGARQPFNRVAGADDCWDCHANATDRDWVFTLLE